MLRITVWEILLYLYYFTWFLLYSKDFCPHTEVVVACFPHKSQPPCKDSMPDKVRALCIPVAISFENLNFKEKINEQ